jgi:superoxide dismutase, Fe-Mn family
MPAPVQEKAAPYSAQNFDRLLGTPGFSDNLLKNHFTLYQGYVKNTNTLLQELDELLKQGKQATPAYAEQQRRFGWEFNGMRLHELYFGNMAKSDGTLGAGALQKKLEAEFGSFDNWLKDFKAVGSMRGIGWAVLYSDPVGKRLFNVWVNEHDVAHLAGCAPLLIMDVFEHAFMLDYGLKRADYIEAFMKSIDWKAVEARFKP